jgi:integrase/recombinase XerD
MASGLISKIHFHSLRHSFASNLAQRGINLYVIQKLLGHSKITTTQIYSHLRNEDLVKAIKVLD